MQLYSLTLQLIILRLVSIVNPILLGNPHCALVKIESHHRFEHLQHLVSVLVPHGGAHVDSHILVSGPIEARIDSVLLNSMFRT